MSNTYFDQVPVEVVKKLCKERIQRNKERFTGEEEIISQNDETNRERPISPPH